MPTHNLERLNEEQAKRIDQLEDRIDLLEQSSADDLRERGLTVAVHNDYRLNGELHTFWLFTTPDNHALKGEGKTDAEALDQVRNQLDALGADWDIALHPLPVGGAK